MARTSNNVDFSSMMNEIFPENQNASASGSKQIQKDFQDVLRQLDVQMKIGLQTAQTQFTHTYNCRNDHEARMSIAQILHQEMRDSARTRHQELIADAETAIEHFAAARKAIINAKRVRNTLRNQLKRVTRYIRQMPASQFGITATFDVENFAFKNSMIDWAIEEAIRQTNENYKHIARTLTTQQKWNYTVIEYLLTQIQENNDTQLTKLTQNAAKCREEDAEALQMALYEFSVELNYRKCGNLSSVHVEKHPKGYMLTMCSIYGCITHQSVIKHFSIETHTTEESRREFEIAQNMMKNGMFYRYGEANNDDDDEQHDNTGLIISSLDESWMMTPPTPLDEQQEQHREVWNFDNDNVDYDHDDDHDDHDDDIATGHTPKAAKNISHHNIGESRHFSATPAAAPASAATKRKTKKKPAAAFKPFHLFENTNRTTGLLSAHEPQDALKKSIRKDVMKHGGGGNNKRGGSANKEVFERWNKKRATGKIMSQMAIAVGYE